MDPAHPIVLCAYENVNGRPAGHGRLIGTYSRDEADTLALERHRAALSLAHESHELAGRPKPDCPRCEAEPPTPRAVPHPWARITNRYRLVGHLDLKHGNRDMLPNMQTRPFEDMAALHGRLHGDPTAR